MAVASQPTTTASDREPFTTLDWGLFTAVALIWGSSFLLIKIGLDAFHPGLITWARVALGAATLALLPRRRVRLEPADRGRLVLLSIVWVAIPFTLFPLAEVHISSAVTGLLNGAIPIFTGLWGTIAFNRVPRGPQRAGLVVGFVGVMLISVVSSTEGETSVVGVVMVLVATLCYGLAGNIAGPLQHRYGSVAVMRWMLALATVWTAPFGIYGLFRSEFAVGPAVSVGVLGAVGTGIAFALMATLVGRVGGPRGSFVAYVIPVVSLALGVAILDETVSAWALGGVALVLAGSMLAGRAER